jgi:hypothetical protein
LSCKFAEQTTFLDKGRICKLDGSACFNYDKPEIVGKCPTIRKHSRGELIGGTPALDYPGLPKCFRQGPYGTFSAGMPPEYLKGKLRREKSET